MKNNYNFFTTNLCLEEGLKMKEKNKRLAKNTIIILISKFCTQFLSLIILPFLTTLLTTDEYGTFDLISTFAWLIAPFMSIQIENGIFRFLIDVRDNQKEIKNIITNGIIDAIIQLLIFTCIYAVILLNFHINNGIAIYLYALSTILLNIPLQISRGLGDNLSYAKSSIIVGISNLVLSIITIYNFRLGLNGLIISGIISNIIGGLYIIFKKRLYKYFSYKLLNKLQSKELIKYSLPLVPNSISSWITSISDKAMISILIGTSANGIYSIATKFSILLSHFFSVFNLSWTESAVLSQKEEDRDQYYSETIDNLFFICSSVCLLVLVAMPIIFKIMINEKFNEAYMYIPFLIIGSMFELFSGLIGAIYISLKKSKNIAISTFIAGVINIIINLLFMRKFGIIVACISTIISYAILSMYRIIDIRKYVNLRLDYKKYIFLAILIAILICLYQRNSILISAISIIITVIYSIIINKKHLKAIGRK